MNLFDAIQIRLVIDGLIEQVVRVAEEAERAVVAAARQASRVLFRERLADSGVAAPEPRRAGLASWRMKRKRGV